MRLVEHVQRDPYKPAIWLLVMTGMRPAELCGLRIVNVDFMRHRIKIVETLLPVRGRGGDHAAVAGLPRRPHPQPRIGRVRPLGHLGRRSPQRGPVDRHHSLAEHDNSRHRGGPGT